MKDVRIRAVRVAARGANLGTSWYFLGGNYETAPRFQTKIEKIEVVADPVIEPAELWAWTPSLVVLQLSGGATVQILDAVEILWSPKLDKEEPTES